MSCEKISELGWDKANIIEIETQLRHTERDGLMRKKRNKGGRLHSWHWLSPIVSPRYGAILGRVTRWHARGDERIVAGIEEEGGRVPRVGLASPHAVFSCLESPVGQHLKHITCTI